MSEIERLDGIFASRVACRPYSRHLNRGLSIKRGVSVDRVVSWAIFSIKTGISVDAKVDHI